jgi:hypothetical protein
MKVIIIICIVFVSFNSFSQNDLKRANQLKRASNINEVYSNAVKVQAKTKGQSISAADKKIIAPKTMAYYDSYIRSIKTKMKYVKSDEVENKKAIEIGWYDEMKSNIAIAEIEKQKLLIDK